MRTMYELKGRIDIVVAQTRSHVYIVDNIVRAPC